MKVRPLNHFSSAIAALALCAISQAQLTSPKQFFGHDIGADYQLPNYTALSKYFQTLAKQSDRMVLQSIGKTAEGRDQLMAIVSSPANIKRREEYRKIAEKLCRAEGLSDAEATKLSKEGKAIVWIDGGLHASEVLGAQQLIESVWQMVSRKDEEVMRILDNVIILFTHANPDGMDLISDWYMQEEDQKKRNTRVPRLYQKYIGHDNNRDFYMVSQNETQNMCKIMYRTWYPQIMYNHHQTGPRGTVMFCPPFRDPFNHNLDPQVITGTDLVGLAMHNRFIAENKPGVTMRSGAPYSTWWNGGLRTTAYFHNMIGILTETIGSPTPSAIPFVASKISPKGSIMFPIEPQQWHFRQSIDYSITANLAILDLAAREKEHFLKGIYTMGHRQIALGSKDTWIDYPTRAESAESFEALRAPEFRSPRAYILPSNQVDFSTAVRFSNALLHTGVVFQKTKAPFSFGGKTYPAGSLVVRCDQAFRPHVLDMFEPQDHPNDIPAPGAAPIPPYDSAGYTLAYQMGVKFDRVFDNVTGDFEKVTEPMAELPLPSKPLTAINDSYKWAFEELAKGRPVFQSKDSFSSTAGTLELKPVRVGLWDHYGGSIESGWTRFIFEKFSVPFKVVYPKQFQSNDLRKDFDVLVFVDKAISSTRTQREPNTTGIPEKYREMLGSVNAETAPFLKKFLDDGGTILTVGASSSLAKMVGLNLESILTENGKALPREKFYIPGSIMQVKVDPTAPLAWGLDELVDMMFDNSPAFKPSADFKTIASYPSAKTLRSGWALGQKALKDGVAIAEAKVGKGRLVVFGPEIVYRSQSHGTFKLLFNGIIQANAK